MHKQWILIPLSLFVALTASANDSGAGKRGSHVDAEQRFARIDSDADGAVSRAEAAKFARLGKQFDKLDGNHDEQISTEEYRSFVKARRGAQREDARARMRQRWKQTDLDGDGLVSRAEAEQGLPMLAKRFEIIDHDQDGQISRQELRELSLRREKTSLE